MRRASALTLLFALGLSPAAALAQGRGFPIPFPGRNPTATATPFELAIGRGDQALRRGEYAAAQTQFEAAARLNATDARPPFYLGEVAARQSRWAIAEGHLRTAIQRNPRMAEAHAELGNVLRELNRGAEATASYQTAIQIDSTLSEAHYGLALLLEDAGQADRALTEYRHAVRLSPNDPLPALNLGILLANARPAAGTQPRAEAFRMLQTAVRNGNNERAVLLGAGPALRVIGEHALAADVLERARAQGNATSTLLAELAQALWGANNRTVALQRIAEAIQLAPRDAALRYVRGLMFAQLGQRAEALADFRQVVQIAPGTQTAQRAQQRIADLGRMPAAPSPGGAAAPPGRR